MAFCPFPSVRVAPAVCAAAVAAAAVCATGAFIATPAPAVAAVAAARSPNAALVRPADPVEFDNVSLRNVVQFLRDVTAANIFVNWNALQKVGVTPETPVSLKLGRVSVAQLLTLSLKAAGEDVTYYVEGNVITITTKAAANDNMVTIIYPVDDLVMVIPNFKGPNIDPSANATSGGGGGNSALSNLDTDDDDEQELTREERMEELVELITELVEPEVWAVNGGKARIRFFRGSLVITAPRYVHAQIGGAK